MRVELVRKQDGSGILRCIREDGSLSWQKRVKHADFFAYHDLTHFAVESVLGAKAAFYGLVSQGWDIDDTTGKGTRGALPQQALHVEQLVGLLDRERSGGALWTMEEFNRHGAGIDERQLREIRALRGKLFSDWEAQPMDEPLVLYFDPSAGALPG